MPATTATKDGARWRLDGTKQYCSGARSLTHALVTAVAPDGSRLFTVSTQSLAPVPGSWPATGMAASDTLDVEFADAPAEPVGGPGGYTGRPGFAHGGAGVAACWYGGARGVGQTLLAAAAQLADEGGGEAGAGAAERVAEGDRAAVDVDLVAIEPEIPDVFFGDHRESLVDLEQIDIVERETGLGQHLARRGHRRAPPRQEARGLHGDVLGT